VKLATAYGIRANRIEMPSEVENALREMVDDPGPYLLDVVVDRDVNVFPMVPAGAAVSKMILDMPSGETDGKTLKHLLPLNFPT
jgi:acetolactate synthase-1/2/3 large subunit